MYKIIQVYAPTASAPKEEIEKFYSDLDGVLIQKEKRKEEKLIVMGDRNSQIRTKLDGEDKNVGNYGYGKRNEREKNYYIFAKNTS